MNCYFVMLSIVSCSIADFAQARESSPKYKFHVDTTWLSPLFVDVRINNSKPIHFIIDSASTWSMIRDDEAKKLGLTTTRTENATGGGGEFTMNFARATAQVGDLKLENIELGVTDLPPYYAGILGADLFENYVVIIDYQTGLVGVYDPEKFQPDRSAIALDVNLRGRIPCIQASVIFGEKIATGEFRVDTAAGDTLTLNHPFAEKHLFPPPNAPRLRVEGNSFNGSFQLMKTRPDLLRIGSLELKKPIVQVYTASVGSGAGTVLAGRLGNEILRRFRVTFDCPHKRIFLKPNSWYRETFEIDMSGMSFGPSYHVSSVLKNSAAEIAGIKPGDVLTKMNNTPVSSLGLERTHHLLMVDGTRCKIDSNVTA
jgi:hypothetical protein